VQRSVGVGWLIRWSCLEAFEPVLAADESGRHAPCGARVAPNTFAAEANVRPMEFDETESN